MEAGDQRMKPDRVVVWGAPGCDQCELAEMRLRLSGFLPEVKDLEKELECEPPVVRMEVMGAYQFQRAFPVLQVNDRGCTLSEGYEMLRVTENG